MPSAFDHFDGHEQVVFSSDDELGLRCIVAIHSTKLGPGLGGTRFHPYASEEAALIDVLRLSKAMSYKAACAGLDLGGGKAVIIGDPSHDKSEAILRAYGRVVESLNGRYITACDVGTYPADMDVVREETRWATGMHVEHGGSGDSGVLTAYGVHIGMQAAAQERWGSPSLSGRHVAVQGLGKVGGRLVVQLLRDGAKVTAADVDQRLVDGFGSMDGIDIVDVGDLLSVDADILSPNALGDVLNATTIPGLQVEVVCGGANNQLGSVEDAQRLRDRDILYAPDYVVNAGGLINVADELSPDGWNPDRCRSRADQIGDTLLEIFAEARSSGTSTELAAERVAERRMDAADLRGFWLPEGR